MLKVAGKKYGDEVAERKNESTFKMVVYPASLPRGEFLSTHFAGLFSRRRAILSLLMRLLLRSDLRLLGYFNRWLFKVFPHGVICEIDRHPLDT